MKVLHALTSEVAEVLPLLGTRMFLLLQHWIGEYKLGLVHLAKNSIGKVA